MNKNIFSIHETFQQTVQGEGYWAGSPCDFIRLYGCPVGCPWCDTGYTTGWQYYIEFTKKTIDELISELRSPMVVISGGEPFINNNLPFLVDTLLGINKKVNIETSGAFWQEISPDAWVTLSPKEHVSKNYPVKSQMWDRANEIKIVISNGDEITFYSDYLRTDHRVFLQPEWNNPNSLEITLDLLKENPQYRLSVQMHKFLGVK